MPRYDKVYLCFDFGMKHIGVAVGQDITRTATALPPLRASSGVPDWHIVDRLIREWQPVTLVVGIPVNMDGTEQQLTEKARLFAKQLEERYQLPAVGVDERLTTKEARRLLFEKGGFKALKKDKIDSLAAKIMLEAWLVELE